MLWVEERLPSQHGSASHMKGVVRTRRDQLVLVTRAGTLTELDHVTVDPLYVGEHAKSIKGAQFCGRHWAEILRRVKGSLPLRGHPVRIGFVEAPPVILTPRLRCVLLRLPPTLIDPFPSFFPDDFLSIWVRVVQKFEFGGLGLQT